VSAVRLIDRDRADELDVDAWSTFFICVLLFQGLSNVALCILRYRLKMPNAGSLALRQMFLWREYFCPDESSELTLQLRSSLSSSRVYPCLSRLRSSHIHLVSI
jgi:hypothetical protein